MQSSNQANSTITREPKPSDFELIKPFYNGTDDPLQVQLQIIWEHIYWLVGQQVDKDSLPRLRMANWNFKIATKEANRRSKK